MTWIQQREVQTLNFYFLKAAWWQSLFLHLWGLESASEGCRAHRGWISSPQLCKPSSGEGQLDSSQTPQPEVTPALSRLHWIDPSKTNSCCYLSHLKTPGARASAGPLACWFGCWLHNEHSVPGGCVETLSRAGFFFYQYCFTQTNGEGQEWAVFITLSSSDSSLRSNVQQGMGKTGAKQ